jgi:hypothetical protein
MKRFSVLLNGVIALAAWITPDTVDAAVIVIANRTEGVVDFEILDADDKAKRYRLQPKQPSL